MPRRPFRMPQALIRCLLLTGALLLPTAGPGRADPAEPEAAEEAAAAGRVLLILTRAEHLDRPLITLADGPASLRTLLARLPEAERARVEVRSEVPFERAMRMATLPDGAVCLPQVSRTAEREGLLWFSRPTFAPGRLAAFALTGHPSIALHGQLSDLLRDQGLLLAWRRGVSYGEETDRLLDRYAPRRAQLSAATTRTTDLVCGGRADYVLAGENFAPVLRCEGEGGRLLEPRVFPDSPILEVEHIACGRGVPDSFRTALDALIPPLP